MGFSCPRVWQNEACKLADLYFGALLLGPPVFQREPQVPYKFRVAPTSAQPRARRDGTRIFGSQQGQGRLERRLRNASASTSSLKKMTFKKSPPSCLMCRRESEPHRQDLECFIVLLPPPSKRKTVGRLSKTIQIRHGPRAARSVFRRSPSGPHQESSWEVSWRH